MHYILYDLVTRMRITRNTHCKMYVCENVNGHCKIEGLKDYFQTMFLICRNSFWYCNIYLFSNLFTLVSLFHHTLGIIDTYDKLRHHESWTDERLLKTGSTIQIQYMLYVWSCLFDSIIILSTVCTPRGEGYMMMYCCTTYALCILVLLILLPTP